ncbi:hypothetical protein WG66_002352 [Moniliophthora roreri]|uniref:Uncharacterized protein n=1 Tax=Moniliophthora roreri TaxID=221103 RepID=A0A0W0G5H9_MONRR|nr:hypothetical protein WG66_002352 [Moniliophthora roreri]
MRPSFPIYLLSFWVQFLTVLAQRANIGFPHDGANVTKGSNFTVEVARPNTLSSSKEIAIVLALQSCPSSPCSAPEDFLGRLLYEGPFNPQFSDPADRLPPHQNFSVQVPDNMQAGRAQLALVHFSLIGAGPMPFMETYTVLVNVL